ncbi:unnamed protein product [Vitrella brassicaformis CCMP3155]|uniref:PSII 6.1 kDa protein n=3 Tax=Sar TaxID=2698737 RepID=A0A0G4F681_VITBC|nr:unnamed protein product [Vitrella brassicaformis CCMP3155]|eukprot:CEM07916.1 unnamed protein product [Vitrella brassicaformis CCMP3155]
MKSVVATLLCAMCLVAQLAEAMDSAAYVPTNPLLLRARRQAPSPLRMSAETDKLSKNLGAALAVSPLLAPLAALATEGTGEPLGVDSPLQLLAITAIPLSLGILFINWSKENPDNEGDFFSEYDRRNY